MIGSLPRRAGAEMVGTYALVTAGCGAIVVNSETGVLGHLGVALSFGLVITVMVAATGHLSGAHLNPAVTLAFALARHFPWCHVPPYIAGQLTGAVGGALTIRALFGAVAGLGVTAPSGSVGQAFWMEVLLTAALMFVITAVATDTRAVGQLAALAIGATVALGALWGGPVTGASMNPARSFGPALVAGVWRAHWVYWLAPLMGASLGVLAYQWLRDGPEPHAEPRNRENDRGRPETGGRMHDAKETVLFLEGDDSARSRMALGWLIHLAGDRYEARTAGPFPASSTRPEAVEAMREAGVEIPSGSGVHTRRYLGERFDRVYAICDQAAEPCPVFPGGVVCWPIPDPAGEGASPEERLEAYRHTRDRVLDLVRETFGVR